MDTTRNTLRTVTGGESARDMVDLRSHSLPCFWMTREAGGPLDAPEHLPAGSCNATDWRTGPWHLRTEDGREGRYVPAQTTIARQPAEVTL